MKAIKLTENNELAIVIDGYHYTTQEALDELVSLRNFVMETKLDKIYEKERAVENLLDLANKMCDNQLVR